MGHHFCRICGRVRANEQFSGKGHRIHVCKRCQRKSERRAIEEQDQLFGFMRQSHISKKNVARLQQMRNSEDPQVASLAAIVLEIARVTPYKRRRLKLLARNHPELLRKLEETGLVFAHTWDWVPTELFIQMNSEEPEFMLSDGQADFLTEADPETADPSAEDWEIPF